jgi:hypothetical protein
VTEKAKAKAIKSINVLMDDLYEAGSDQVKCSSSEGKHLKKATFFVLKWFFGSRKAVLRMLLVDVVTIVSLRKTE